MKKEKNSGLWIWTGVYILVILLSAGGGMWLHADIIENLISIIGSKGYIIFFAIGFVSSLVELIKIFYFKSEHSELEGEQEKCKSPERVVLETVSRLFETFFLVVCYEIGVTDNVFTKIAIVVFIIHIAITLCGRIVEYRTVHNELLDD